MTKLLPNTGWQDRFGTLNIAKVAETQEQNSKLFCRATPASASKHDAEEDSARPLLSSAFSAVTATNPQAMPASAPAQAAAAAPGSSSAAPLHPPPQKAQSTQATPYPSNTTSAPPEEDTEFVSLTWIFSLAKTVGVFALLSYLQSCIETAINLTESEEASARLGRVVWILAFLRFAAILFTAIELTCVFFAVHFFVAPAGEAKDDTQAGRVRAGGIDDTERGPMLVKRTKVSMTAQITLVFVGLRAALLCVYTFLVWV